MFFRGILDTLRAQGLLAVVNERTEKWWMTVCRTKENKYTEGPWLNQSDLAPCYSLLPAGNVLFNFYESFFFLKLASRQAYKEYN